MNKTICAIGGVTVDTLLTIDAIPDWDSTSYVSSRLVQQGGMAATAMAAASALGCHCRFYGATGNDHNGAFIRQVFRTHGIECHLQIFDEGGTAGSTVLVEKSSGRRIILHHTSIQVHDSLDLTIDLAGVHWLHLDGYWLTTALAAARQAKAQHIPVSIDPSSRLLTHPRGGELLQLADWLIPGRRFAEKLTSCTDMAHAATDLAERHPASIIVTDGEHGCWLAAGNEEPRHIPAFKVDVRDTTGAGDVFHGAFIAAMLQEYPPAGPAGTRQQRQPCLARSRRPGAAAGSADVEKFLAGKS
jgi:sugar/nucleoside kinase (ribokinase family)